MELTGKSAVNAHFHRFFGALLLALYIYLLVHHASLLPGLDIAPSQVPLRASKIGVGWLVIFGLPLLAICCFLFPTQLMWRLSPRTPPDFDYLLTEGFWYLLGYALLLLSIGVLSLFRQQLIG
jgi:hypothetical protein